MQDGKGLLGIIGGMGTQATACFYEKLHRLQDVKKEQGYLDVLLYSMPSIPDRTAFITGQSKESPLMSLIHAAKILESAGVSCIALPCATSHFFYNDLADAVSVPIINMLDETARYVKERGIGKVCLLATDGTIKGGAFHSAFEKYGIEVAAEPSPCVLMDLIYDIKRGARFKPDVLDAIIKDALETGAEAVVLGCTELCVVARESPVVINTLDILAASALREAGGGY